MAQLPYKQFRRSPRVELTEESFNMGVSYTNAPLREGFFKEMVNFDIKDSGDTLIPRPGLRAFTLESDPTGAILYSPNNHVSGCKVSDEDSGVHHQIILALSDTTALEGTELYTGTSGILTSSPTAAEQATREMKVTLPTTQALFKKPDNASIHGITVTNLDNITRQIGTFAFNGGYYGFKLRLDETPDPDVLIPELYQTVFENDRYVEKIVTPRTTNPKEAVMWGYNMLDKSPYLFDNELTVGTIIALGIMPYDAEDNLKLAPNVNEDVNLRCFYKVEAGLTYRIVWEWKEPTSSDWTAIKTETVTFTATEGVPDQDLVQTFSSPCKNVMVRITFNRVVNSVVTDLPDQVMTVGFSFDKSEYGSSANAQQKTYSLHTATGMAYWKNRLICYGVQEDKKLLFLSEVNDPSYFPYPNNTEVFNEAVLHVLPFLDKLLVFTSTQLHMLTLSMDGLSWNVQHLQNNLNIKEWDIHLIQAVKNMVFFKSGNYYYMIVPKANSMTGELVVAPISKNIEYFLDNFQEIVEKSIQMIYNYDKTFSVEGGLELVHYYNFLDFEDIHNVYVIKTPDGVFINYSLLYNTITRTWRTYIYESENILTPFQQDATKKGVLLNLVEDTSGKLGVQYLHFDKNNVEDAYIHNSVAEATPAAKFPNHQMFDTGYREQSTDIKKRYRELQLKLNNLAQVKLAFCTEFYIDGDQRKAMFAYKPTVNSDANDPNYGTLSLSRVPIVATEVTGATTLAVDENDVNSWVLDSSALPEAFFWKVRIPVSGKGFTPRMRLLSFNQKPYEILNIGWVFRTQNAR